MGDDMLVMENWETIHEVARDLARQVMLVNQYHDIMVIYRVSY